jgi:hypothetical protein
MFSGMDWPESPCVKVRSGPYPVITAPDSSGVPQVFSATGAAQVAAGAAHVAGALQAGSGVPQGFVVATTGCAAGAQSVWCFQTSMRCRVWQQPEAVTTGKTDRKNNLRNMDLVSCAAVMQKCISLRTSNHSLHVVMCKLNAKGNPATD